MSAINATDDSSALLMPVRFAAKRCSVRVATIRRWIQNRVVRGRKVGGRWYALREDIEAIVNNAPNEGNNGS